MPPLLVEVAALLAAAIIILRQVIGPPVIGLANNSDWGRMMVPAGLGLACSNGGGCYSSWVATRLGAGQPEPLVPMVIGALRGEHSIYLSSELLPVYVSLPINNLVSPPGRFDLRVLGVVHAALFLACAWTVLVSSRAFGRLVHAGLCVALVAISTDVSYVQFFNSFYAEPASLAFLWLLVGTALYWLLSGRASLWISLAYYAVALLFVLAKPQNLPLAIPICLLGLWAHHQTFGGRLRLVGCGLPALLCAAALSSYMLSAKPVTRADLYNIVFSDILTHSADRARDLEALGLDPVLMYHANTKASAPMPNASFWNAFFFERIGYPQIVWFYVSHPHRLLDLGRRSSAHAFSFEYKELGNYEETSGMPPGARSRSFSRWTRTRASILQPRSWVVVAVLVAGCVVAADLWRRRRAAHLRRVSAAVLLLPTMAGLQFATVVLAGGDFDYDLRRHLFLFNVLSEWVLVVFLLWSAERLWVLTRSVSQRRRVRPLAREARWAE